MKTLQRLLIILFVLSAPCLMAQTVSLYIRGIITQTPAYQPYPFHYVQVEVYPDSTNPALTIIDSTLTDVAGHYSFNITAPWVPGNVIPIVVSTWDCQQFVHSQFYYYISGSTQFTANFSICSNSVPAECSNYFNVAGSTGLTASLWGHMLTAQPATYSWNFGDGTTGSGEYITHTFPASGTYNVTLSTITPDSCMDNTIQSVTVYDSIPPSTCDNYISISNVNGLLISAYGGMINQQSASYSWNFGDGSTAGGINVEHTYASSGTYTISLTTVTTANCTDITYMPVTVIDSLPAPCVNNFNSYPNQLSVNFSGWFPNQQTGTFSWSFGDGTSGSGQNVNHVYAGYGSYNVTLSTLTTDSCADVTTKTITLIDSTTICSTYFIAQAGTNLLEVNFQGFHFPQIPSTYTWGFGDGSSGTGQTINHTYSVAGNYLVTLTSTDTSGCTSQSMLQVMVGTYNYSLLQGRIFANGQSITACQVQLYSQDPAGGIALIQTTVPDSANYYFFQQVPSGIYYILATPFAGSTCASQFLPTYFGDEYLWENSTAIMLGVANNPYDINLAPYDSIGGGAGTINGQINTGGKSVLLANEEVLLIDNAGNVVRITYTDSQGNYSFESLPLGDYQVYPNITGITTVPANVQLTATSPMATVNMTISGGTITGLANEYRISAIARIYPNPVIDNLSVEFNMHSNIVMIEVLDAYGRIILQQIISDQCSRKLELSVRNIGTGMYILRSIDIEGNVSNMKFLKK
ncbi:MAG: PKD domain-containing protein [Bacteroidetes bacterium]|nr:PKD domain-containing protein [Bacteroidota bacterium]